MSYLEVYKHNLKTYIQIINRFLLGTRQGYIEKVKDAVITLPFTIPRKTQKKDFLTEGKIPIIDQGQSFIAGYTDDDLALIKNVPIIIFGDHTRLFKYVDFPFAQGADGIKMLNPKKEYLPEFFFFQLQSVDLENRGYSRHYKYLLEHEIVGVKSTDLQKNIVMFLRHLEKNELKASTYFNLEVESRIESLQKSLLRISVLANNSKNEESMIQELRQAILQEAVSGRLVPQDPKDEPISELLKETKAEKERLVGDRIIKKEKALPPITQEEIPYPLPNGWEWVRLIDLIALEKNAMKRGPFGGSLRKDTFVKNGYLVYEQRHAIHNDFNYGRYFITPQKFEEMIMFRVVPGDLIISCSGVTLGKISEIPEGAKEGIINQALLKIRLNNSLIKNRFFINLFNSTIFQARIFEKAKGSAIPNMVGVDELKKMVFGLPPLREQERIVLKIDDLMKLLNNLEAKIEEGRGYSQLLMETVLKEALAS